MKQSGNCVLMDQPRGSFSDRPPPPPRPSAYRPSMISLCAEPSGLALLPLLASNP